MSSSTRPRLALRMPEPIARARDAERARLAAASNASTFREMLGLPPAYEVRNADGDVAEIDIADEISWLWGIDALELVPQIRAITAPTIRVYLNSPGGDVFDGLSIYNALVMHASRVEVVVVGVAASIASVIAQAGDTVRVARGSEMMIHDVWGVGVGNEAELRQFSRLLGQLSDNIADLYAGRSGEGDADTWRTAMRRTTWYGAQDAVDAGLADELADPGRRGEHNELEREAAEDDEDEGDEDEGGAQPDAEPDEDDADEDEAAATPAAAVASLAASQWRTAADAERHERVAAARAGLRKLTTNGGGTR